MSTVRTRSALLTWGAVLFGGTLLVTACTGDPVATGTVPVTSSVVSTSDVSTSTQGSTSTEPTSKRPASSLTSEAPTPPPGIEDLSPVVATVPTNSPSSPAVPQEPSVDVPAGAHQETVGGAQDFVRWWFELGAASLIAGSNSTLEEYSSPACSDCNELIARNMASLNANESVRLQGDSWVDVIQTDLKSTGLVTMIVIRYVPPVDYLTSDGSVTETVDASAYMIGVDVAWTGSHWVVSSLRPVQK